MVKLLIQFINHQLNKKIFRMTNNNNFNKYNNISYKINKNNNNNNYWNKNKNSIFNNINNNNKNNNNNTIMMKKITIYSVWLNNILANMKNILDI